MDAKGTTVQPRDQSPSIQMRHLKHCSPAPTRDCVPKALGVWGCRQRGCCTPRSSSHGQTGNSQDKHPDQIPQHGHGQTNLSARNSHRSITTSPSIHRAGTDLGFVGPLRKCCFSCVFVNGALKSRGWWLCTRGCGEGWA